MVEAIWSPERRAKAEALKKERHDQRKVEQAARWHPYRSYREKQKAEAADRRRLKALDPKKRSSTQFTSERSKVVQLSSWRSNKAARLTALGRRENGQWRGKK